MNAPTWRRNLFFLALASLLVFFAYSNTFHVPFIFDDFINIINRKSIRMFTPDIQGIVNAATKGSSSTRWLPNLTFALNYYIGGEHVKGYHIVNLLIHLLTTFIFYLLSLTTLNLPVLSRPGRKIKTGEIALAAALIWALHPLQTNAVTYIVQRMTSLCTLFYLSALLCYVRARTGEGPAAKRAVLYFACLICGLLALISKENSVMLPAMIIGYDLFFLRELHWKRDSAKILLWGAGGVAVILIITFLFLGNNIFSTILADYKYRDFTLVQRLLTETRIIFLYLSLLVYPSPSRLNLNHEIAISHGLLSPPQTALAIIGLLVLIWLIFYLYHKNRLVSFALFWFLGNLVIESTIVPLELIYEHRLYLPATFLILAFTASLYSLNRVKPWMVRGVCLILVLLFTFWTWQRNQTWGSAISLWSDVVAKSPGLARGYNNLGVAYHEKHEYTTAQELFNKAIQIEPDSRLAYISLASMDINQNRLQEARKLLFTALSKEQYINPSRIYHYLGVIARKEGKYQEAISYSELALRLDKSDLEPLINLGIVYEKLGDYPKADATFDRAQKSGLTYSADLYNNWGIVKFKMGQTDTAIKLFKKALRLSPNLPEAHYNLGLAYGEKGMNKQANEEMERAMHSGK